MKEEIKALTQRISTLEQQLSAEKEKNAFNNALIEGGNLIIWSVNEGLKLVSFNQNYFNDFFDASPKTKIGYQKKGVTKIANSQSFWTRNYKRALKGKSLNFEIQLLSNSKKWLEVFLNPIYDVTGESIGVSGLAYDITEKMQSRIDLISSEEKFRTIFESFQDVYFRCDFSGKLTMLSPSVEDITGNKVKNLIGKNITNFYIYSSQTKKLLRRLVDEKRVRNFEADIIHESGNVVPCICNIRIIFRNGKPESIEGVVRNITELKKANQQLKHSKEVAEKSLKIKERFLANMSHEIRTPLNGIMGMIHLLDDSNLSQEHKHHVQALKSSSEILLNVLNDLLDISKIEADKMIINNSPMNVYDTMSKIVLLYNSQSIQSNIDISCTLDENVPQYIVSDETKLIQVFSNLISNAIKFTPEEGKVSIHLKKGKERRNGEIELLGSVTDTGIGISEKDKRKLFKSFTQLDSSVKKAYKGTGLGLYITKKLIKLLKGKIGIDSKLGEGSTFWFTFKTRQANEKEIQKEFSSEFISGPRGCKVLIVDDNQVNLQVSSQLLVNMNCNVTTVNSGKKAIEKSKEQLFDLILMDIQMPDMDGITTSKKIRLSKKNKKTPIIAMTAYSMSGDREKFLKSGMDDFIAKPIKPKVLHAKINKWFKKVKEEQAQEEEIEPVSDKSLDINLITLENLRKYGGDEIVKDALNEFNNEFEQQLISCYQLFDEKNYKEILIILHTLKGNSGTLGLEKVSYYSEYLEEEVKKENYHNFTEGLETLQKLYLEYKQQYNTHKDGKKNLISG
ncbi:MAG: response regulator [Bacteroidota bacterium]